MQQPQQPGKKKANPDCPLCHGYGMIVEDECQKSAPACHLCFPMEQELAKASAASFLKHLGFISETLEDLSAPASPVEDSPDLYLLWLNKEIEYATIEKKRFHEQGNTDLFFNWGGNLIALEKAKQQYQTAKPSPVIEIGEMPADFEGRIGKRALDYARDLEKAYGILYGGLPRHPVVDFMEGADWTLKELAKWKASHPAPSLIVGEREGGKYPIGGYAPGNYSCHCVTCKGSFIGDKRAIQCEPCATKMVEEAGGKDYAHIHVNLPNGAIATVSPDTSPELLNALTKMVDLAKDMPDAPTEQAPLEEITEWIENEIEDRTNNFATWHGADDISTGGFRVGAKQLARAVYEKMQEHYQDAIDCLGSEMLGYKAVYKLSLDERNAAREQLASARTLILNIKRGNIYQEPADECDKWLHNNPETK